MRMVFAIAGSLLLAATPAYAYVDPGVGAMLWQALLAGAFGSMFFARSALTWARQKLSKHRSRSDRGERRSGSSER